MATKRTSDLPLICLVCGDIARGLNFNVMTCISCKAFFRRHALKSETKYQCQLNGDCEITLRTRSICTSCRLKKCFSLGMNPTLIRNCFQNQNKFTHNRRLMIIAKSKNRLPEPSSLNLLQNDCSLLTTNEWNLLSNIIHAYDAINAITKVKYLLDQQSSLPPKIRSKSSVTFDIIKFLYSALQQFFESPPYFYDLPISTRRTLMQHNLATLGTLNSIYIMREVHALDNSAFLTGCNTIYGYEAMRSLEKFTARLESNGILIKIMFLILAYSTNCSIVIPDYSENITSISSIASIINIENIFVTAFWKYLMYQHGFFVAVQWFNSFIKYILDVLQSINDQPNAQHDDMVGTIVEKHDVH